MLWFYEKSIPNDYVLVYLQQKVPRPHQTFNNSFWKQSREPFKFSWNQVIRHLNWLSSAIPLPSLLFFWVQKPPRSTITQDTCYHTTITHKSMYFYCMYLKVQLWVEILWWNQFHEIFSWNWFHEIFHEIDFTKCELSDRHTVDVHAHTPHTSFCSPLTIYMYHFLVSLLHKKSFTFILCNSTSHFFKWYMIVKSYS